MSNYNEAVLQLIQKTPGLRAPQISDRLDIDLEIVQNVITKAVSDNQVEAQEVVGPNKLPAKTYFWIGMPQLGWTAPLVGAQIEPVTADTSSSATGTVDLEVTQPEAASDTRRSKATVAIEYLSAQGPTHRKDLAKVMGLHKSGQVSQFLRPHLQSGKVACIDGIYCVPDNPAVAPGGAGPVVAAASAPVTDLLDAVKSPVPGSGGIELVDILRARLTPEELRGYFKGNVIRCLLDAEHGGGAQDYRMGSVYANWLAETIVAEAA